MLSHAMLQRDASTFMRMVHDERSRQLAARIRELREAQRLSRVKLGRMMGSESGSTIEDIEYGKKSPTFETLCKIADALEVDVRDLFG